MDSPNRISRGATPAAVDDVHLFYPDVEHWEWREFVEEAPARALIDGYAIPRTLRTPLGAGLRGELEAIRGSGRSPEQLVRSPESSSETSAPRVAQSQRPLWVKLVRLLVRLPS
jgi:hypothetical protein